MIADRSKIEITLFVWAFCYAARNNIRSDLLQWEIPHGLKAQTKTGGAETIPPAAFDILHWGLHYCRDSLDSYYLADRFRLMCNLRTENDCAYATYLLVKYYGHC